MYRGKGKVDTSDLHVPLLDINPEGRLQREIKDILEELDIMIHINRTHRDVLKDFITHVEHMLDPEGIFGFKHRHGLKYPNSIQFSQGSEASSGHSSNDAKGKNADGKGGDPDVYDWFKINADELLSKVTGRIEELEVLRKSAETTSNSVSTSSHRFGVAIITVNLILDKGSSRSQTTASQRRSGLAIGQTI